jgi:outer membrane protein assembly factor BamA
MTPSFITSMSDVRILRIIILLAGLFFLAESSIAQYVTVQNVTVSGLKRTKATIVHRELTFAVGDTILQNDLGPVMERNRNNLLNLGIFNEAIVNVSEWDTDKNTIDITVELKESWYIYPAPILDLADRNFNVWWTTYNHSIDRINLGGRLDWLNFTGRNDKLKATIQFGYTPKQEIEYRFPYLNKAQSLGISTKFLHSVNKEVYYETVGNKEQFVHLDERTLQERWEGQLKGFYRPSIFLRYELGLTYQHIQVDQDVVTDYNPIYFSTGDSTQGVFSLRFVIEYDDRDLKIFPSRGLKASLDTEKIGLTKGADENALISTLSAEWNVTTGRRFQHRISSVVKYSLSRSLPSFTYYRGIGAGVKYVSGYELYVVDGLDFVLGKYQLAYKLLEKQSNLGKIMPVEQFRRVSYAFYISLLAEAGYSNDPYTGEDNNFANRILYGGGPALTMLLYNNFLFQFSYATNHLGEWGFFIHNRTSF